MDMCEVRECMCGASVWSVRECVWSVCYQTLLMCVCVRVCYMCRVCTHLLSRQNEREQIIAVLVEHCGLGEIQAERTSERTGKGQGKDRGKDRGKDTGNNIGCKDRGKKRWKNRRKREQDKAGT